ncbi:MAG: ATP-dependent DNA helicase RecG [Bryobacter sp.]|nr:ATP-dependent DNA helicase RecG [Bryobacter sp.]
MYTTALVHLNSPLQYLKGVGPTLAAKLQAKGLETVEDLLFYPPFRYEDRSRFLPFRQFRDGQAGAVLGTVSSARTKTWRNGQPMFEAELQDEEGNRLLVRWYNARYLASEIVPGLKLALFGKAEFDFKLGRNFLSHPEFEVLPEDSDPEAALHAGRIVPIYETIGKISRKQIRRFLSHALPACQELVDALPAQLRARYNFPALAEAVRLIHAPELDVALEQLNSRRSPGHLRLIFEEFFWLEFGLLRKQREAKSTPGIAFQLTPAIRERVKAMLPFKPTEAQKRALKEIAVDMAKPSPMNRLLQGDVGSGKTLVAAESAVIAVENGYQVALLAPTEILAAQHYLSLTKFFRPLGYAIALVTGSQSPREKAQMKKVVAAGLTPIVVGTHALLEKDVEFAKLGLVIIDEQHRFGVLQRMFLRQKGLAPDVLVMTATPIPRTLALTLYGDLDVSIIDQLPPGRRPVRTEHVTQAKAKGLWPKVRRQLEQGRQAYVVYPLVDESENSLDLKSAVEMHRLHEEQTFSGFRVGLLHGQLPAAEKEAVMDRFKRHELDVLVSTTVIEVGVDVPNATVMVIENAEKFGLAQLHQLRGRVGRGAHESFCYLVTGKLNDVSAQRIRAMTESNDGFRLAETDLEIRGPGEFFGTRQSGLPQLRFAHVLADRDILEQAREEAMRFIEKEEGSLRFRQAVDYLEQHWQRRYGLAQIG